MRFKIPTKDLIIFAFLFYAMGILHYSLISYDINLIDIGIYNTLLALGVYIAIQNGKEYRKNLP